MGGCGGCGAAGWFAGAPVEPLLLFAPDDAAAAAASVGVVALLLLFVVLLAAAALLLGGVPWPPALGFVGVVMPLGASAVAGDAMMVRKSRDAAGGRCGLVADQRRRVKRDGWCRARRRAVSWVELGALVVGWLAVMDDGGRAAAPHLRRRRV